MRCLCPSSTDVYFNLATEEYLLKNSPEDYFILWQSDRAVVIGKNQDAPAEADLEYAKDNNLNIARRFSGGGAVYQDLGNLNLTFIESTDRIDFNTYINRVLSFLSSIGLTAKADERLGITLNGLKISGSAQCVHKNRVMYHCTLLFSTELDTLDRSLNGKTTSGLLPGTRQVRAVPSVRSQVTNINREMPHPPTLEKFKETILQYFCKEDIKNNCFYQKSQAELAGIEKLRNEKYARKEWIFDRKTL